jgi:hypothetical protein
MAYLEEKSQEMLAKCEQLSVALKLYEGNYQGNHALLTKLKILSGKIELLDGLMNKNKGQIIKYSELINESQDLHNQIGLFEEHQIHLIENLPDSPPIAQNISLQSAGGNSYFDNNYMNSNINSTVSSVVSPIPDSWKDLKSPSPCFMNKNRADNVLNDKTNFITQHANKSKPMLARNIDNKPNIPHVLPICENELKLVPA